MVFRVYYGEISESRKENWDNGEKNPYDVLVSNKKISGYDWMSFLTIARKCLKDEIQIDWGSFAWKGNEANKEYTLPELAEAAGIQVQTAQHLKQRAMDKIYAETGRFDLIKHWSS